MKRDSFPKQVWDKLFLGMILVVVTMLLASCKKDTVDAPTSFTLYVVNGSMGTKAITNFAAAPKINYQNRSINYVQTGQHVQVKDSAAALYLVNQGYEYNKGVYTLFIYGDSTNAQAILKEETDLPFIPNDKLYTSTDSVVNVRFINLSPNSVPLKIKISTATTNEADALAYKEITTWRAFKAAPAATTTYSIQIRNATTDALITTYSFAANATKRFKNVTLMIRGLMGTTTGVNAFGVTEINYF